MVLSVISVAATLIVFPLINPTAASAVSKFANTTNTVFTALAMPVVIFVLAFVFYSLYKFREKPATGTPAEELPDGPNIQASPRQQVAWLVMTAVLAFTTVAWGMFGFYKQTTDNPPNPLVVDVTGQQWLWSYSYPAQGVTSSVLYLPAGRPVKFRVTSKDVLHGFVIDALGVAMDGNPGWWSVAPIVTPTRIGSYYSRTRPEVVLGDLLGIVVDRLRAAISGRRSCFPPERRRRVRSRSAVDAWLAALTDADPVVHAGGIALAVLAEELEEWRRAGERYAAHRMFRTCFRCLRRRIFGTRSMTSSMTSPNPARMAIRPVSMTAIGSLHRSRVRPHTQAAFAGPARPGGSVPPWRYDEKCARRNGAAVPIVQWLAAFSVVVEGGRDGAHLTAANHVIHFDRWWNPAVEDQATDRAFRIGQRKNVQVRKLTCVGTLEERIDTLINQKKELADRIVGSGEAWITDLRSSSVNNRRARATASSSSAPRFVEPMLAQRSRAKRGALGVRRQVGRRSDAATLRQSVT